MIIISQPCAAICDGNIKTNFEFFCSVRCWESTGLLSIIQYLILTLLSNSSLNPSHYFFLVSNSIKPNNSFNSYRNKIWTNFANTTNSLMSYFQLKIYNSYELSGIYLVFGLKKEDNALTTAPFGPFFSTSRIH